MDWTTTGTVMRKMMSSTSMTSTSGVVLMSDIGESSPPSLGPTLMAMFRILSWQSRAKADGGDGADPVPAEPAQTFFGPAVVAPMALPVAVVAGRVAPAGAATTCGFT